MSQNSYPLHSLKIVLLSLIIGLGYFALFPEFSTIDAFFYEDLATGLASSDPDRPLIPYIWQYFVQRESPESNGPFFWKTGGAIFLSFFYTLTGTATLLLKKLPLILLLPLLPLLALSLQWHRSFENPESIAIVPLVLFCGTYGANYLEADNYLLHAILTSLYLILFWAGHRSDKQKYPLLLLSAFFGALSYSVRPEAVVFMGLLALYGLFRTLPGKATLFTITAFLLFTTLFTTIENRVVKPPTENRIKLALLQNYNQLFYFGSPVTFQDWRAQGAGKIVKEKILAVKENLITVFTSVLPFYLYPFLIFGLWKYPFSQGEMPLLTAFPLTLFAVYSLVFTIPGTNGSLYHSLSFLPVIYTPFIIFGIRKLAEEKSAVLLGFIITLSMAYSLLIHEGTAPVNEPGIKMTHQQIADAMHMDQATTAAPQKGILMCFKPIPFYRHTGIQTVMIPLNFKGIPTLIKKYSISHLLWPHRLGSAPLKDDRLVKKYAEATLYRVR